MKRINSFHDLPPESEKIALTIGTFDGVHRGHQQILSSLSSKGVPYVLTFNSHPHHTLQGEAPLAITHQSHKLELLEKAGVEVCCLLDFTPEFARQSARTFLTTLKQQLPFSSLVLGHDARIGHQQEGDRPRLQQLAEELQFDLTYLPAYYEKKVLVSSRLIRSKIEEGSFDEVEVLLGRPYSIAAPIVHGMRVGRVLGFPTANLNVGGLVLPKQGVWICEAYTQGALYPAIANLGYAPTLCKRKEPLLEVHLLDVELPLYGEHLELFFHQFVRPELRFESQEALRHQIDHDVAQALLFFNKR